jgi:hypothetical protein
MRQRPSLPTLKIHSFVVHSEQIYKSMKRCKLANNASWLLFASHTCDIMVSSRIKKRRIETDVAQVLSQLGTQTDTTWHEPWNFAISPIPRVSHLIFSSKTVVKGLRQSADCVRFISCIRRKLSLEVEGFHFRNRRGEGVEGEPLGSSLTKNFARAPIGSSRVGSEV